MGVRRRLCPNLLWTEYLSLRSAKKKKKKLDLSPKYISTLHCVPGITSRYFQCIFQTTKTERSAGGSVQIYFGQNILASDRQKKKNWTFPQVHKYFARCAWH